jgi:hypothetical protein
MAASLSGEPIDRFWPDSSRPAPLFTGQRPCLPSCACEWRHLPTNVGLLKCEIRADEQRCRTNQP